MTNKGPLFLPNSPLSLIFPQVKILTIHNVLKYLKAGSSQQFNNPSSIPYLIIQIQSNIFQQAYSIRAQTTLTGLIQAQTQIQACSAKVLGKIT